MSQNDNNGKAECERSNKLCQLIQERRIDEEVGFEIRKLLEEGVLIDFQDQSRHKKTALHLAVGKTDVICVKLLLQFKPTLEVKDEDGRTPVELAKLHGFENILNILVNSTVDVANESCIEVIDYESITRQKIEAIKSRPTFKVLKMTYCPSVNEVWVKLDDHDYAKTFNESSHLFFIAIETDETSIDNNHELMKKVLNLRRPMIVQLHSSNSRNTKIYFKDEKDFVEITDTPQITQEDLNKYIRSEVGFSKVKLLVAALRSNLFGHFTGDLLGTKLNTNESRNEAVNQFARSNALCHRFLKLFDESPPQIDTIIAALSFKGDQSLLALLDLPFELNEEKLKLIGYQQDILRVVDSCGCNLLMLAAEQGNLDAVKLLLRCGCDFNQADSGNNRASDICWDVKAFDCLASLIEAGSPYPNHFSIDELEESSESQERINEIIDAIKSFHGSIEEGEIEEVKKFMASHPHIKHAYDTNNKCALTVALQSNRFDIHSLLMSEGFEPGGDDEYYDTCSKSSHKNEIRNSHRKYFKEAFNEPHLKRFLNKYRLSFGSKDRAKCSTIIRKMFDELNEIDEIIPILQICSTSDKLRIVFDFNCDSVVEMDPTKESEDLSKKANSLGAIYPSDGFVYIGARNQFYEVIGNLVHELTHYAMKLTYENCCKPYDVDDITNTNRFENITIGTEKISDENPSTDPIVTTVFECYKKEVWHQELIVRVPQLLAYYKMKQKALEAAERNTPELFHFYREKTLKDVATKSKVLLQEYMIRKINKQTGTARKIENLNVRFQNVEEVDLKSVIVITSNAPQLTLAMLNQVFEPDSHIFVTLEQVALGNVLEKIFKINAKESSTTLIVDCIGWAQKYPESARKLLQGSKSLKSIALVMTEAEGSVIKESKSKVEFKTYIHKWGELTESTKVNLLNKFVFFQGFRMALIALVDTSSEAMNFFPLSDILKGEDIKIGSSLPKPSHNFYIPRQWIRKDQADDPIWGVMIISDEAGSGKSATLFEIAKNMKEIFPGIWILFVDLKLYIEAFKGIEDYKKIESFHDFISEHILKDETEFDRELFKEMFRAGKTSVLFDGFDEVSPNFKDLLLHVLNLFQSGPGNQLFITTRPHLEEDLEGSLGKFVYKLEDFSEESQISFLREYWRSLEISHEDFEILSSRLLEKFSDILVSEFIGLPLLMRMTAEIFSNPIKENLVEAVDSISVASIFKEFVDKYFLRWTNSENEISRSETVELVRDGGILEIHHNIAIKHIFGEKFAVLEVDEGDTEKIARVGLIRYDKTEKTFQFIHETFAEYFVADFICFHLRRKNRNPSHDCRLAIEIFSKILYDLNYHIINTFLEQTLETTKLKLNEAACQSLGKCFSDVIESKNCFGFLSYNLYEGKHRYENIAILLLSIVKYADKDVLLKILEGEFNGSALHNAASYKNSKIVSTLCNIIATCIDCPQRIFQHEHNFKNVLFSAARNKNQGILTALCEGFEPVFTSDENKIMFQYRNTYGHRDNIILYAAEHSTDEVFNELIVLLHRYLSVDELKRLVLAKDRFKQNCIQRSVAKRTKENVKMLIDFAKSLFVTRYLKTFFRLLGVNEKNIFHLAAENRNEKIFQTIFESACDVLSSEDFKTMLMQKDSGGSNVLHCIAEYGNGFNFKELISLLRDQLSDDEIRSLLLDLNGKGQNCFLLVAKSHKINFQVFRETIENLLPLDDLTRQLQESFRETDILHLAAGMNNNTGEGVPTESIEYLLTKKGYNERNLFQTVALTWNVETWNQLVAFAQTRFSNDEMKAFLFDYSKEGESCFHLAVANAIGIKRICDAVWATFKSVFNIEDQRKIVQQRYSDQTNVFHQAGRKFDKLKFVCDYLSEILSRDEIKVMLQQKDSDDRNILFYLDLEDFNATFNMHAFLTEILSNDEIKSIIFDEDCDGLNCFQYSGIGFKSGSAIKSLSDFIKKILNHDDQIKFFGSKNLFLRAIESRNPKIFSIIHSCLKDVFTENEIKSMIQDKDPTGNNILHLICQRELYCYSDMMQNALKVVKNAFNHGQFQEILTSLNNNGSNCLLLAVKVVHSTFLKKLFTFFRNELSLNDLKNMIQKHDNDGNNIFMCAAQNGDKKIFSFVEVLAREILSQVEMRDMLLHDENCEGETCVQYVVTFKSVTEIKYLFETIITILNRDNQREYFDSHNLFHMAAKNNNRKIFSTCHECLKRVFTHNEIKSMIQAKDSIGNNILLSICQQVCQKDLAQDVLPDFFKVIKKFFNNYELKEFLTSSNDHDSNCLLIAVKFRNEEFLENLFAFIQAQLSANGLQNLIKKRNIDGNTIFKFASQNHDSEIFLLAKSFAKEILSKDQYKMLHDEFTIAEDEEGLRCETDEELCHSDTK